MSSGGILYGCSCCGRCSGFWRACVTDPRRCCFRWRVWPSRNNCIVSRLGGRQGMVSGVNVPAVKEWVVVSRSRVGCPGSIVSRSGGQIRREKNQSGLASLIAQIHPAAIYSLIACTHPAAILPFDSIKCPAAIRLRFQNNTSAQSAENARFPIFLFFKQI